MSFSTPGYVKVFETKGRKRRYYFGHTVGEGRCIAFTELKKRIDEDVYTGTDLTAARAIIDNVEQPSTSEAASQFLNARRSMKGEGFTSYQCEDYT